MSLLTRIKTLENIKRTEDGINIKVSMHNGRIFHKNKVFIFRSQNDIRVYGEKEYREKILNGELIVVSISDIYEDEEQNQEREIQNITKHYNITAHDHHSCSQLQCKLKYIIYKLKYI